MEGSVGLATGHQIEEQCKSGDKSQGDKDKTLYFHNSPQTETVSGENPYQPIDPIQSQQSGGILNFCPILANRLYYISI